jgi:hypothetical protein
MTAPPFLRQFFNGIFGRDVFVTAENPRYFVVGFTAF